jgi:hypothetical protein
MSNKKYNTAILADMITTTLYNGRLGNQIIRNISYSIIAEKHNLKVAYSNHELIAKLGIDLFTTGSNVYEETLTLHDCNYFEIYESDSVSTNLDPNHAYFQTAPISQLIYNYLRSDHVKARIIDNNQFKGRYNANNDLFVHLRLDDVGRFSSGIDYYSNAIKNIQYDNIYISTDEETHPIVIQLRETFPQIKLIRYDEIGTFQFGSTCKHVILSHGSFSATIGYLSFFSTVYYPEYERIKCGTAICSQLMAGKS